MYVKDKIKAIEFRMMSPKFIKAMSSCKIITPELYDADGYPIDNGLMNLKLGVVDPGLRCRTCGSKVRDCPGHFGFIELARPVIHIGYANSIYNILKSTCRKCGRVLLGEKDIEKWNQKDEQSSTNPFIVSNPFLNLSKKMKNASTCPFCGEKQKKIKFSKPTSFMEESKKLTPVDIRERMERIPDDDLAYLGLDVQSGRPEWMVITLMPVPPVTVRPSITLESGQKSEDDLTHKLADIVRTNQRLSENINAGAPQIIIDDLWELLQYHVTTFFNNNISKIPAARHRSGRVLKTLADRIKSKEGRFRHNLAGKRVDFSARSVISPDSEIMLDEVGVPYDIAKEMTLPEVVTKWNIKWLKEFVKNGSVYPGANYVLLEQGRKKITEETKKVILEEMKEGDVVERHILDGDLVLFNRQPSLHRMSLMGHKAKVLPFRTFRINPAVTRPYNADFDGDEMNLHVPQNEEARAEVETLMELKHHIISPRYGLPIIGGKQDHIIGCYLLTKDDTPIDRDSAIELMVPLGIDDLPKKKSFTGKELFSMLMPKNFNFIEYPQGRNSIIIKSGKMLSGFLSRKSIGGGKGIVVQEFYRQYGPEETLDFLYKLTKIGIGYLMQVGFSVSPSDTDLPEKERDKIKKIISKAEQKVRELIDVYERGELEPYPGRTPRATLEIAVRGILDQAREDCGEVIKGNIGGDSRTKLMIKSGAVGSLLNIILIAGFAGQQSIRGERIVRGYYNRTTSHFKEGDIGPSAHGFVFHGYGHGLSPVEFFFHAIAGRDSLVNKGMRTPKSGYLQRRLVNALQDLTVRDDMTVRGSAGNIVQFLFGEDGIDVSKSYQGTIDMDGIIKRVMSDV